MQTAPPPDETKPVRSSRPEQVSPAANGAPAERDGFKKVQRLGWIPKDWGVEMLSQLGEWRGGGTPKKSNSDYWGENGTPWVSPKDMKRVSIDSTEDQVTEAALENSSVKLVPIGSILIVTRSGILQRYVPIATNEVEVAINQDLKALTVRDGVSGQYILYALLANRGRLLAQTAKTGTTVESLDTRALKQFSIPLPPLPEQRRIAAVLADWDRALAQTGALLDARQRRKKALMQQLLTGKTRLPGFADGKPVRSSRSEQVSSPPPREWREVRVKDLGEVVTGGTPKTSTTKYWNGDVAWCTPTDITALPGKDISQTERTLTQSGVENSSATVLPPNSLIVCTRATVGDCAVNTVPMATNQGFKSIIPSDEADVSYLYYWFNFFKHELMRLGAGSTFLEVSKKDFSRLEIDLPPLPEQRAIASILATCDEEIETLRAERDALQRQKKGMMQKLLTGRVRVGEDDVEDREDLFRSSRPDRSKERSL